MKYSSGEELLKDCSKTRFSLIFLDIEMTSMSGMEVASSLYLTAQNTEIIFVSGFEDYVYESFKYKPLRFIQKEHINKELPEALEAFYEIIKSAESNYPFSTKYGKHYHLFMTNLPISITALLRARFVLSSAWMAQKITGK